MTRWILCLAVLCGMSLLRPATATEPCGGLSLGRDLKCTRCATVPCCCPDDYCRKPMPCIPCLEFAPSPNCYCPKPEPCVPCPNFSWCPDNYCPKPMPRFCWPVNWQFYRCPPGSDQPAPCASPRQAPMPPEKP